MSASTKVRATPWRSFSDILPPVCSHCSILRSYRVVSVRRPNYSLHSPRRESRYKDYVRARCCHRRIPRENTSLRTESACIYFELALRRPHIKGGPRTRERSLRERGFESFGLNNFKSWHISGEKMKSRSFSRATYRRPNVLYSICANARERIGSIRI